MPRAKKMEHGSHVQVQTKDKVKNLEMTC